MSRFWREHIRYTNHESFGGSGLKTTGQMVFGFMTQNLGGVPMRSGGNMWQPQGIHIEAKLSHEEPMAIGSTNLELNHNTLKVR